MYHVLLYYHYTRIEDVEKIVSEHRQFCREHDILGRIYFTEEGVNGTVSGSEESIENYKTMMIHHPLFRGITFKESTNDNHTFQSLRIKYKKELVNLSLEDDVDPKVLTGHYLTPEDFIDYIDQPNTVIIDARNDYESKMGYFKGALRPNIRTFRELPDWVRNHKEELEGKTIVAYCTGGVRCEKFTGWLKREGFEDVHQLHGGIQTYGDSNQTLGKYWEGTMYVFDDRISVPINKVTPTVIGKDHYTKEACNRMFNCGNPQCNEQIFGSQAHQHEHLSGCSLYCSMHPENRYVMTMDPEEVLVLKENLRNKYRSNEIKRPIHNALQSFY